MAIRFNDINDTYCYGVFGPLNVMIMKRNGFINATKLCNDLGKDYRNWLANNSSKELIKYFSDDIKSDNSDANDYVISSAGIPADGNSAIKSDIPGTNGSTITSLEGENKKVTKVDNNDDFSNVIIKITGGDKQFAFTRGTYVHPLLIVHIASWCSPAYAYKVSKIVTLYQQIEYETIIKEKEDKITHLRHYIEEEAITKTTVVAKLEEQVNILKDRLIPINPTYKSINNIAIMYSIQLNELKILCRNNRTFKAQLRKLTTTYPIILFKGITGNHVMSRNKLDEILQLNKFTQLFTGEYKVPYEKLEIVKTIISELIKTQTQYFREINESKALLKQN